MRILVKVRTNKIGSECVDEFDLPDNSPLEEIEECAQQAAFEMMDWHYEVVE